MLACTPQRTCKVTHHSVCVLFLLAASSIETNRSGSRPEGGGVYLVAPVPDVEDRKRLNQFQLRR